MDFEDILEADAALRRLETIHAFLRRIPVLGRFVPRHSDADMRRIRGPILSMTPIERSDPRIIDESRCGRISRGCGLSLRMVRRLVDLVVGLEK